MSENPMPEQKKEVMRTQMLQQQLQQTSNRITELKGQYAALADMIREQEIVSGEIRGALRERLQMEAEVNGMG